MSLRIESEFRFRSNRFACYLGLFWVNVGSILGPLWVQFGVVNSDRMQIRFGSAPKSLPRRFRCAFWRVHVQKSYELPSGLRVARPVGTTGNHTATTRKSHGNHSGNTGESTGKTKGKTTEKTTGKPQGKPQGKPLGKPQGHHREIIG